jgi:hypothetical protein
MILDEDNKKIEIKLSGILKNKILVTRTFHFSKFPTNKTRKNTPCKVLSSLQVFTCKVNPQGGGTSIPKMSGHHKAHNEVYHEPKHTQLMGQRLSSTLTYAKSQGIGGGWLLHLFLKSGKDQTSTSKHKVPPTLKG